MRVFSNARWVGGGTGTVLGEDDLLDVPEPSVLFSRLIAHVSTHISMYPGGKGGVSEEAAPG